MAGDVAENSLRRRSVFITGAGSVSSLGMNLEETVSALRGGVDCSREVTLFSTEGCQCRRAMELPDPQVEEVLQAHPQTESWHRVGRMLLSAMLEASSQRRDFAPQAAVFGTTSGGMSFGEEYFRHLQTGGVPAEMRRQIRQYLPQQAAMEALNFFGWSSLSPIIISNACASGTNAIGHAWRMISTGVCERVVCGGYDAISRLVFAGFESLKALSPDRCRPFDRTRSGLMLGEAATVLFLESGESVAQNQSKPLAEVAGYGSGTDLFHLTQPDPTGSGPLGSMKKALEVSGIRPEEVDYINAHGTATLHNDASEGRAVMELFPNTPVSSTKAMTGHTLGAAGALEAVIGMLAIREGFCPVQVNLREQDPEIPVSLVLPGSDSVTPAPRVVVSNSFGFGGANASIILREVRE